MRLTGGGERANMAARRKIDKTRYVFRRRRLDAPFEADVLRRFLTPVPAVRTSGSDDDDAKERAPIDVIDARGRSICSGILPFRNILAVFR